MASPVVYETTGPEPVSGALGQVSHRRSPRRLPSVRRLLTQWICAKRLLYPSRSGGSMNPGERKRRLRKRPPKRLTCEPASREVWHRAGARRPVQERGPAVLHPRRPEPDTPQERPDSEHRGSAGTRPASRRRNPKYFRRTNRDPPLRHLPALRRPAVPRLLPRLHPFQNTVNKLDAALHREERRPFQTAPRTQERGRKGNRLRRRVRPRRGPIPARQPVPHGVP